MHGRQLMYSRDVMDGRADACVCVARTPVWSSAGAQGHTDFSSAHAYNVIGIQNSICIVYSLTTGRSNPAPSVKAVPRKVFALLVLDYEAHNSTPGAKEQRRGLAELAAHGGRSREFASALASGMQN